MNRLLLSFLFCGFYAFADMTLHYEFEEDLIDSSGSQSAGTVVGAVGYTSNVTEVAVGDTAVTLAGGANYITLDQQINFSGSDLWSVAFWAKRAEIGDQHTMVMGARADNNNFIWLNDEWSGFRFRPSGGGSLDFTVTQDMLMHHYALVVEGDGTMSLYVDGELSQNKSWGDTSFQINAIGMAYTSSGLNFEGVLDDVRIYTNKLDATGVYTVYTNNTLVQALLDIDFEDGLTDKSAAGNDGSFVGSAAIVTNDPAVAVGSSALKLNGDGSSYVTLDHKISFSAGEEWSVIFRARRAALTSRGMVIGERADETNFIWLNDNFDGFRFRSIIWNDDHTADFISPKDTKLHHYALVADGTGKLDFYRDGDFRQSVTKADTSFDIDTIGRAYNNSDYDFGGEIDDVKVYAGALEADLIKADYESGWDDDLLLYYPCDQDLSDQSLSANDGSGGGAAAIETDLSFVSVGSGSLSLDGADNSYLSLSSQITFTSSNAWSVAFWAQRGEVGGDKGMVAGKLGNGSDFIWLNDSFAGLRFRGSTADTFDFTSPKDMLMHHYTLVANGNGGLSLYVDGEYVSSQSGKNTSFAINAVGLAYPTTSLHYSFQGQLDDFRVYGDALDADAAAALYAMRNAESDPEPGISVTQLHVYLQGGQSNGDGRADPSGLPTAPVNLQQPQADVDFYYMVQGGSGSLTTLRPGLSESSQFGPEITYGRGLVDQLNLNVSNRVAVIKYANGGTTLYSGWIAGGDATTSGDGPEYVVFQQTLTAGLAALATKYPDAEITIEGMTWMQGESDTSSSSGTAAYFANMTNFIADVRLTVGIPYLPFVIGRLSSGQTALGAVNLQIVMDAQSQAADVYPWVGLVDTDAFGLKTDNLHFDAAGQQSLGYGFVSQLLLLQEAQLRMGTLILLQ